MIRPAMNELKRQDLPTGLWVVATPIGNLGDLSPRALSALAHADAVLCEDTRRTAQLLSALGLAGGGRLRRLDAHAGEGAIAREVERLTEGASAALVTDAGTPGVSDPGSRLVAAARAAGVKVTAVPGPSAVTALLSVAGWEATEFSFRGFFPRKPRELEGEGVQIWFESPLRIGETLAWLAERAPAAPAVAAKELTKVHEKVFAGSAREVAAEVASELEREGARGEWVLALELAPASKTVVESSEWVKALHCLLDARVAAPEAAKRVSQHFGVERKRVYAAALELSGKIAPKK
jgi:16S rRNA (cytidine1402-2'-O)-methyltransferase